MRTQLDFIIFGPGRSGTTAFAAGFNLHPKIFCATEFLPIKAGHSAFHMPEDMLRMHLPDMPHRTVSVDILREKLSRGEVGLYGNKMPNYYLRLDQLRQDLPKLKLFYIYRSPLEFVHSWDRRARRENDKWNDGRLGIFGAIEQIFCLKRLAGLSSDATMTSYNSLLFDDPELMARVVDGAGVDATEFDQRGFEQRIFRRQSPKAIQSDFYAEFFDEFRFDLVDAYFSDNPLSRSGDLKFKSVVKDQFDRLPPPSRFGDFVWRVDPAAQLFGYKWRRYLLNDIDRWEAPACQWLLEYARIVRRQIKRNRAKELMVP